MRWHAVLPTLIRLGEPFRLAIKADDKWGNPSNLVEVELHLESFAPVSGLPKTVRFERGQFSAVVPDLKATKTGDLTISVMNAKGDELCRSNPLRVADADAELVYFWGDTHGQSNETLGTNSAREYFEFGRDKAFLDVVGHQGNDFQITGTFWKELNLLSREFDKSGSFVCIPGYEWSANSAVGGDRNVHFRHEGETIYRSSHAQIASAADMADEAADAHDAHRLFEKLQGKDCVVVAHVGGRYADITYAHDAKLETAVEVHSAWGTFEWIVRDAFEKNFRVGIVANSDGHKGRPGACYPGASFFGSQGGLTCFIAPRLDRDAIFEAMRRRRHYCTTGNRMLLDVTVELADDAEVFARDPAFDAAVAARTRRLIMGDIARVTSDSVRLTVDAFGTAPIERIDIFDGLDHLETVRPYGAQSVVDAHPPRLSWRRISRPRTHHNVGWLARRDRQRDQEGRRHQQLESRSRHPRAEPASVTWKAVTTGNYGAIDLWLERHRRPPRVCDQAGLRGGGDRGYRHRGDGVRRRRA